MKKIYEEAQIEIFLFDNLQVIVASSTEGGFTEDFGDSDPDALPILPAN